MLTDYYNNKYNKYNKHNKYDKYDKHDTWYFYNNKFNKHDTYVMFWRLYLDVDDWNMVSINGMQWRLQLWLSFFRWNVWISIDIYFLSLI